MSTRCSEQLGNGARERLRGRVAGRRIQRNVDLDSFRSRHLRARTQPEPLVRNGFVPQTRRELLKALSPLKTRRRPFVNLPEPSSRRGAVDEEEMRRCVWVRPDRKAEIEFAEQTAGGRLRHAAFRQLVDEKN